MIVMCKLFIFSLLFLFSPVLSDLLDWSTYENEVFPREYKKQAPRYCQSQTPCGWVIHAFQQYDRYNITNDYCSCKEGYTCELYMKMPAHGFDEYRCKLTEKSKTQIY